MVLWTNSFSVILWGMHLVFLWWRPRLETHFSSTSQSQCRGLHSSEVEHEDDEEESVHEEEELEELVHEDESLEEEELELLDVISPSW
jgi:hypothetical protein